jgi:hypothetical protein
MPTPKDDPHRDITSEREQSQAQDSKPQTDPRADILWKHFWGRTDAFAHYNRETAQWQCTRREIPPYLIASHLAGKITVATYPVNDYGNTPFISFDVDSKAPEAYACLVWLSRWFTQKGSLFLFEDTGGRGLHGWTLFKCHVPATQAIALANLAIAAYKKEVGALPCPVEIFPKQAKLQRGEVGNCIRLPWGKHQSGDWSHFLNEKGEPDDANALESIRKAQRVTESDIDKLLPEGAIAKVGKKTTPRLVEEEDRWAEVIPEGRRHDTLVSLAGELRARRFSPERLLTELKMHNAQRCQPPLADNEVETIVKGVTNKTVVEKEEIESCATQLVQSFADAYLFHDKIGDAFIRVNHDQHYEIWSLESKAFADYARFSFYSKYGKVPSATAVADALNTLIGKAKFEGPLHELNVRVAWHDGNLYYDLTNPKNQAVRVNVEGWAVVDNPPILFERYQHMTAQVLPETGGAAKRFLDFANLTDNGERLLLLVWLVLSFIPGFPHLALMPYGTWGAGKTFLFRLLKSLVDPSAMETLSFATDRAEFAQQLSHHWLCLYDNIHAIPHWVSDLLCRAITGEGFSKRRLYTDRDDIVFKFKRIVGLDGLELAAELPDLLDRSLILELQPIPDNKRRRESDLLAEFDAAKPQILGGVFDTLVGALGLLPTVSLDELPRMADWVTYGCAVAEALGYEQGRFLQAYASAVKHQSAEALRANLVGEAVLAFMENMDEYEDTLGGLLKVLTNKTENLGIDTKGKGWPKQPNQLSKTLKAMKPNLEKEGLLLTFLGHAKGGNRLQVKKAQIPSPPSPHAQTESEGDGEDGVKMQNQPSLGTFTRGPASGEGGEGKKPYSILRGGEEAAIPPEYPVSPCPVCGSPEYSLCSDNKWVCPKCTGLQAKEVSNEI